MRGDLVGAPIIEMDNVPRVEMRPTTVLLGWPREYWQKSSLALLTIDGVTDSVMGLAQTHRFKTVMLHRRPKSPNNTHTNTHMHTIARFSSDI